MNTKFLKVGSALLCVGAITACGSGNEVPSHPSTTELTVCIASEPDTIDPALNSAVDGATMLVHLESGLMRYKKVNDKLTLVNDLAEKIDKATQEVEDIELTENADGTYSQTVHKYPNGTRYTVKLRDDIYFTKKSGKGRKITAADVVYSWNRASGSSLAADYCYMFEPICNGVAHETCDDASKGGVPSLGIKAVDDRTLTIDVMVDVPYFDQLLAFPTFFIVDHEAINDTGDQRGKWATSPDTYVSCGAYKLTEWVHNSYITLEKNPDYWDAANIVATKIKFALSDDDAAMLASFKKGDYDLIDSVPNDQIDVLKKDWAKYYHVEGQMGTYYVSFNMNSTVIGAGKTEEQKAKIRIALAKLLDRKYIVDNIGKADQTPANAFVSSGISDADGNEFVKHNGPNGDGAGYFDNGTTDAGHTKNVNEAITALKECGYTYDEGTKKFTNFPAFKFIYNTGSGHQAIAENIRDTLNNYGITVNPENQEWNTFLNTRKNGDYDVARNGWVADYDDPSTFLSMWTTQSGNNDSQYGKGAHGSQAIYSTPSIGSNLTWAQSYDVLMDMSSKETNKARRFQLLHEAENLLMTTGGICPIYFYTDIYMVNDHVKGFFTSPLGYKFFHFASYQN